MTGPPAGALLLAMVLRLPGAAVAEEPVERILAVVGTTPVLLSEVRAYARFHGIEQAAALSALVDEQLMLSEAARLPEAQPSAEEAAAALDALRGVIPAEAGAAFDEGLLRRLSRRQATILKYVGLRFRPQLRVEAAELRRAYEQEYGGRPGAPPFDQVAGEITSRLERKALDERIEAWVRELRASGQIRYNP